jgi:hypothetical protein
MPIIRPIRIVAGIVALLVMAPPMVGQKVVTAITILAHNNNDTQKVVNSSQSSTTPINCSGVGGTSDEHISIFPPNSVSGNSDYLFFVATARDIPKGQPTFTDPKDIALEVLSSSGPDTSGQWSMQYPPSGGYGQFPP